MLLNGENPIPHKSLNRQGFPLSQSSTIMLSLQAWTSERGMLSTDLVVASNLARSDAPQSSNHGNESSDASEDAYAAVVYPVSASMWNSSCPGGMGGLAAASFSVFRRSATGLRKIINDLLGDSPINRSISYNSFLRGSKSHWVTA